jgi:hypothetical protein
VEQLTVLFKKLQPTKNRQPYIILLGHQYTPENFSYDALKLNDRPKAEALLQAAKKAACYGKMCLVTSFLSGAPEYDGYYGDEVDDDTEMAEVYDKQQSIEYWLKNDIPALSNLQFEEEDLIASFALDEGEPILKESTGYMGNYGPDINHWYHYGAVVIWSKEVNAQLLLSQDTVSKLEWLRYFCENPDETSEAEIASANAVLSSGLEKIAARENADYNAIADWVMLQNDESFFKKLSDDALRLYFTKIEPAHWLKLFVFLPADNVHEIIGRVMEEAQPETIEQLLSLRHSILTNGKLVQLATPHIEKLPSYFETMLKSSKTNNPSVKGPALQHLFWISEAAPQSEGWIRAMVSILSGHKNRHYINAVLVPTLLALQKQNHLTRELLLSCRKYFQQIAANKPQPPADWRRPVPDVAYHKKEWEILRPFLESPVQTVFEYRKNQSERAELENAIKIVEIDLKTETIKKGSPHTLKITKTQAAYNKSMKEWEEDISLLEKIVDKLK